MAKEYIAKLNEAQWKELSSVMEFTAEVLPTEEKPTARNILKKLEHAKRFPSLGVYEVVLNNSERKLIETLADVFDKEIDVMELR